MLSLSGNSYTESTISQIMVTHFQMKLNVNHVAEIYVTEQRRVYWKCTNYILIVGMLKYC